MSDEAPLTYGDAGVSLGAADEVVRRISAAVQSTHTKDVLGGLGGFSGLYTPSAGDPAIAAGCDGVGTKILLGAAAGRLHGLGIDLVAMSVNDVITTGARPAFFLDVITCGRIQPDRIAELVEGIAAGCRDAGCALLGGETAEHPDMMEPDEFDMAGFAVAVGERRDLIGGARARAGDAVIGLASSGPALERVLAGAAPAGARRRRARRHPLRAGRGVGGRRAAGADPHLRRRGAAADRHPRRARDGAHHRRRHPRQPGPAAAATGSAPRSTCPAGNALRCSPGWRRWAWTRTRCGGCSTSASATRWWSADESTELALRTLEQAGERAWVAGRLVEGDGVSLR